MAATPQQQVASFLRNTTPDLNLEQMRQFVAALTEGTRRPKVTEPEVYRGEQNNLRGWLAQLVVYYKTVGWYDGNDDKQVLWVRNLLRNDAETWIPQYAEERMTPTWSTWAGFKAELRSQFGVIDAKGEARMKLKNMKQGKRSVTEYWNKFGLVASEAKVDYSTGGELLLQGINMELQNP